MLSNLTPIFLHIIIIIIVVVVVKLLLPIQY